MRIDSMSPLHVIAKHAPAFHAATAGMPYVRRGVWWSELLAFYALAKEAGATYVVESGTGLGHSSRVLARLFRHVITIGMEPPPKDLGQNVDTVTGDAWEYMWQATGGKDCAVLIDGPKHKEAVHLAGELQAAKWADDMASQRPKLIAIHDMQHGSPGREFAAMMFPKMWFSDADDYVDFFGHMDWDCMDMASKRGKTFANHGPTIGIVTL